MNVEIIGNIYNSSWVKGGYGGTVFNASGLSPAITNFSGGYEDSVDYFKW